MKLGAAPALFREEQGAAVPGRSKSVATCSLGHEYPNGLPRPGAVSRSGAVDVT
jgi:hypothetical protein